MVFDSERFAVCFGFRAERKGLRAPLSGMSGNTLTCRHFDFGLFRLQIVLVVLPSACHS